MLERLGLAFEGWVRRNMPDPFVLVLLLTGLSFASALILQLTPHSSVSGLSPLLHAWFVGFADLLSFSMQMVLIVATGEAIVSTRPIQALFKVIAKAPRTPASALWILASFSLFAGWVHWGLGLIGAALLARQMALTQKSLRLDYPLMGAAAYLSMLLWHAGTTASAPLLINTPGHFLQSSIGLVPLSETIFLPMNLIACVVLFLLCPFLIVWMHPQKPRTVDLFPEATDVSMKPLPKPSSRGDFLDQSAWIGRAVGALGIAAVLAEALSPTSTAGLNHNTVNFLLLSVGLCLHGSPLSYARAVGQSVKGTSGIVLQYPFYGGVMGLMKDSGLGHFIAHQFIAFASAHTLPFFAYLAATFTKLFIPSGGGEWAVEGPVMLEAAKQLGAPLGKTTMGIAYGNMVGNLFQPFWALPLLSVLGLKARDILGYCLVILLFAFPILGLALLI